MCQTYLVILLSLTATIISFNTQEYFDPNAGPIGESPDGGAWFSTFNFSCDPWRNYTILNDAYYDTYPDFNGDYCPQELRSPSGCGDFKGDTRGVDCSGGYWKLRECSMRVVLQSALPVWKAAHLCDQDQMPEYQSLRPTLAPFGNLSFPPFGINRHRPYWAVLGEYQYLPPQRWLHNAEHGYVVFLYQPCIEPEALCKIKQFIASRPYDNTGDPRSEGPFRWIMTPYKELVHKFAVVTYYQTLLTDCFHWDDWNTFIDRNYRQAFEDYSGRGRYDYLWISNSTCTGYAAVEEKKSLKEAVLAEGPAAIAGIIIGIAVVILLIVIVIVLCVGRKGHDSDYAKMGS